MNSVIATTVPQPFHLAARRCHRIVARVRGMRLMPLLWLMFSRTPPHAQDQNNAQDQRKQPKTLN